MSNQGHNPVINVNDMAEEIKVDETTAAPAAETKQSTDDLSVDESGKTVPYERFKDVVKQRNDYKELLEAQSGQSEPTKGKSSEEIAAEIKKASPNDSYDDALKIVDNRIEEKMNHKLEQMNKKIDLDRTIAQNPDFFQYSDLIKAKVKENPHLSWNDAYKLSRYETSIIEAQEAGKKAAYKKIEEKKSAGVEPTNKTKVIRTDDGQIDPLAKGPDGKYLYSLKELRDILPSK